MSELHGFGHGEELAEDLQKELPNRIIAELERLKTEMLEEQKPYHCLFDDEYCKIIDKRIAELKGK